MDTTTKKSMSMSSCIDQEEAIIKSLNAEEKEWYLTSKKNFYENRMDTSCKDRLGPVSPGYICFIDYGCATYGREMGYQHLGIVLSVFNGKAFVVPLTSNQSQLEVSTHMTLLEDEALNKPSVVILNDAKYIATSRIISFIGKISDKNLNDLRYKVIGGIIENG